MKDEALAGERADWLQALRRNLTVSEKSWWTTFWLSLFLGLVGADRFYLGSPLLGILKLVSFGGFYCWWFVDFVLLVFGNMKDGEGKVVKRANNAKDEPKPSLPQDHIPSSR